MLQILRSSAPRYYIFWPLKSDFQIWVKLHLISKGKNSMHLKPIGLAIVAVSLTTPLIWLPPLAVKYDTIALFSQYLGMVALIAMALGQIIATRLSFVEHIFGGLDRSYVLHKWLGIGAMVAILLHDTIDAEMDGLGRNTILIEAAETAGEISLYGFLILVVITVATFIPYHLWRWTHRIIGVFFILSAFHFLFMLKPFSNGDPLGLYVSVFCFLGILAFVYKSAPRWLRPSFAYEIADIAKAGRATAITMTPAKRTMKYRAGQFAFVTFDGSGSEEPHPFTISKAPDESGSIRMTVSPLGDFSYALPSLLKVGASTSIEGPFGRFERKRGNDPQVWIAAGIGITPFVAWAQALTDKDGPITLFYCARNASDAAHLDELKRIEGDIPNLKIVLHETQSTARLNAETILRELGSGLSDIQFYFCGPKQMRKGLATSLASHGVSARRFHYEEFEIRSGVGLRLLAQKVLRRL
jgi:predicted ferric reductase